MYSMLGFFLGWAVCMVLMSTLNLQSKFEVPNESFFPNGMTGLFIFFDTTLSSSTKFEISL